MGGWVHCLCLCAASWAVTFLLKVGCPVLEVECKDSVDRDSFCVCIFSPLRWAVGAPVIVYNGMLSCTNVSRQLAFPHSCTSPFWYSRLSQPPNLPLDFLPLRFSFSSPFGYSSRPMQLRWHCCI